MNSGQWTFENPAMLFLLLLIIPLIYIRYLWKHRGGRLLFSFSNWEGQGFNNFVSLPLAGYLFSQIMSWAALVLIIIALAGPSRVFKEKVFISRGIDIMLVIDVSPSMAAQDSAERSRLENTQETIRRFVDRRKNDPVGLTAFGSNVALRVPPTLDYTYLKDAVNALQVMELGEGTALGMGIALGALHLHNSSASEKIIILFTDGESNAGEILPQSAASLAADAGIRIYVIDIGSEGDLFIDFVDPDTGKPYRATYRGRQQEELLKEIAGITGGEYYSVTNSRNLERVLLSVDGLEWVETRLRVEVLKEPQHRQLIIIALILIFLDYFLRKMVLQELL